MKPLMSFIKLFVWQWRGLLLGFLLSLICILSAVGLLAVSGWLICAAAFAGLVSSTAIFFDYFIPAAGIRFFALSRILSRYGERVITHNATFKILRDLRVWVYQKIEPLAPAHFYRYVSGDLLQRFVSDVDALNHLYLRVLSPVVVSVLIAFLSLLFLSFFNHAIAQMVFIMLMSTTLITCLVSYFLGKHPGKVVVAQLSALRTQTVSNVQGMMDLTCFGALKNRVAVFEKNNHALIKAQEKMSLWQGLSITLVMLASGVTLFMTLMIGIPLVYAGQLNGAILGLIILAIMGLYESIVPLPAAFQFLGQTVRAAERVTEITGKKPTVLFQEESADELASFDIVIQDIHFAYPGTVKLVLEHYNLQVKQGEHLLIAGASGVGKTTLMQLLVRSWDPQKGTITIGGIDLRKLPEQQLRKAILLCQQRTHIFNASIRDNLKIANPNADDNELIRVLDAVLLADMVRALPKGLDTEMGEFGEHFSGGQIKRFGLARALLSEAPIVILDEPSEGVDADTFSIVWENIRASMQGRTLLVVSHQSEAFGGLKMQRLV